MWRCLYYQKKKTQRKTIYKAVVTLWHIHAIEYDATVKMNEAELINWHRKNVQDIVLHKRSRKDKKLLVT